MKYFVRKIKMSQQQRSVFNAILFHLQMLHPSYWERLEPRGCGNLYHCCSPLTAGKTHHSIFQSSRDVWPHYQTCVRRRTKAENRLCFCPFRTAVNETQVYIQESPHHSAPQSLTLQQTSRPCRAQEIQLPLQHLFLTSITGNKTFTPLSYHKFKNNKFYLP